MNGNESTNADAADSASLVSVEQLQRLVRLFDRSDVSELELRREEDGSRLVLRKAKASDDFSAMAGTQLVVSSSISPDAEPPPPPADTKRMIVAPLVGIFHPWAKPRGKALVTVGDRIKVGQIVATIESLNVMNEVEAVVAGRVAEVLVQNGQPVEYGQPLMS
ncbi:MAG TPA: biotin/lipoyl-containing protein, partial [Ktedonobacteraceae bacterium]|nr:biotin/lipoyl-containing protein [Ktedonobacteraceae bacterium]